MLLNIHASFRRGLYHVESFEFDISSDVLVNSIFSFIILVSWNKFIYNINILNLTEITLACNFELHNADIERQAFL